LSGFPAPRRELRKQCATEYVLEDVPGKGYPNKTLFGVLDIKFLQLNH